MNEVLKKLKQDIWEDYSSPQSSHGSPQASEDKGKPHHEQSRHTTNKKPNYKTKTQQPQGSAQLQVPKKEPHRVRHVSPARKQYLEKKREKLNAQSEENKKLQEPQQSPQQPKNFVEIMSPPNLESKMSTLSVNSMLMPMQQTAVSKIRREIFHLPKSSPYTEYVDSPIKENSPKNTNLSQDKTAAKNPTLKQTSENTNDKDTKEDENGNEKKEMQRMRGFFICPTCKRRWKSLHVYCEKGTKKVLYGQLCETCKIEVFPVNVRRLRCETCNEFECDCAVKRAPLLEPKLEHRRDLCVKCRSGNPC